MDQLIDRQQPKPPEDRQSAPKGRLDPLDFAKGALVVCMVIYHSLNYSAHYEFGFRYLGFLPLSFILITGFLLSAVYFARPASEDRKTSKRLVIRGAKLLVLFTALNVGASFFIRRSYQGVNLGFEAFLDHAVEIYILGQGGWAVFDVLLPIGYLLIFGPLLLAIHRRAPRLLPVAAMVAVVMVTYFEERGTSFAAGALLTAGLVGVVTGGLKPTSLSRIGKWWFAFTIGYLICWLSKSYVGDYYVIRVAAAVAALAAFFGLGATIRDRARFVSNRVIQMGKYSLPCYIGQIGVLQVLSHWFKRPEPGSSDWWQLFALTLMATSVLAEVIDFTRSRSSVANSAYKLCFA